MSKKKQIKVNDLVISVLDNAYISLTDLAKFRSERPADTISNWMRSLPTIKFLGLWEQLNNADFKVVDTDHFKGYKAIEQEYLEKGNGFVLYPAKWIFYTNANGFQVKKGRYGGTWAHEEIALEFASWLSPELRLYVVKEFKRLKELEYRMIGDSFSIARELTRANNQILRETIELHKVPPNLAGTKKGRLYHASEQDLINKIVYGRTASEWRRANPDKPTKANIRDFATAIQLTVHNNLLSLNSRLIKWMVEDDIRESILLHTARDQFDILKEIKAVKRLDTLIEKQRKLLE
ncbi:MAG: KilA-N domain-containing protein [Bacteroidota bacterium]